MRKPKWLTRKAQRILDVLVGDGIFSFQAVPSFPVVVIKDFRDAFNKAYEGAAFDPLVTETPPFTWLKICEEKILEIKRLIDDEQLAIEAIRYFHSWVGKLPRYFPKRQYSDCSGYVIEDFESCFLAEIADISDQFLEKVLQVYEAGCWPCGWEGEYPDGMLIVFREEGVST